MGTCDRKGNAWFTSVQADFVQLPFASAQETDSLEVEDGQDLTGSFLRVARESGLSNFVLRDAPATSLPRTSVGMAVCGSPWLPNLLRLWSTQEKGSCDISLEQQMSKGGSWH